MNFDFAAFWRVQFNNAVNEPDTAKRASLVTECCHAAAASRHDLVYEIGENHPHISHIRGIFNSHHADARLRVKPLMFGRNALGDAPASRM